MQNFDSVKEAIEAIVHFCANELTSEDREYIEEFIEFHEFGEAFHLLSFALKETQLPIPAALLKRFVDAGRMMGFDESFWSDLVVLDEGPDS